MASIHSNNKLRWSGILLLAALLYGCAGQSEPSRFYLLSSPDGLRLDKSTSSQKNEIKLGVGPITLPSYLKRPQLVARLTTQNLELAEFDRWAEPLEENFSRVLAENLSGLLSSNLVAIFPWNRAIPIDYQVTVRVIRFDTDSTAKSHLVALWRVFGDDGRKLLFSRRSSFSSTLAASDFDSRVKAMNINLAELSREIAIGVSTFSN
jgi:hypothetical protein|tara:strand:+ start:1145 stop:1765 length:621 start_codon:yes stop_codon:yes gene_type:complete